MPPSSLNRASLRRQAMHWTHTQRRVAVERVIEQLPDAVLLRLLKDLVHFDEPHADDASSALSLGERVAAHVEATRRGAFLGDILLHNKHDQREPWQTSAWVAATWHLFDLALERAAFDPHGDTLASLRDLVNLVAEVDERIDQLVVFEEDSAGFDFDQAVRSAKMVLGTDLP